MPNLNGTSKIEFPISLQIFKYLNDNLTLNFISLIQSGKLGKGMDKNRIEREGKVKGRGKETAKEKVK